MPRLISLPLLFLISQAAPALGQAKPAPAAIADDHGRATARLCGQRGAKYLIAAQDKDGGWMSQAGPGIACLILKALINEPGVGPDHPAVERGLKFVAKFQRPDGGIYSAVGLIKNYETSVALSMYAALPEKKRGKATAAAQKFLTDLQWDEGEGKSIDDVWYGGAGYGHGKRPDLSNTQMMLDALHDGGVPKSDPVYKRALVFLSRCQMLPETNDQPFAHGSTDGGFIYSPANGGESKAGTRQVEGRTELRSYGSMTYAGLKSMLYAGLTKGDPRVKAAREWIGRYWTLDFNPNMPGKQSREGLYYYYHTFARTMAAWGEDTVADAAGRKHDWRRELTDKLTKLQRSDGSWANEADRWMEGYAGLTTAYSMLALQAAFPGDVKPSTGSALP